MAGRRFRVAEVVEVVRLWHAGHSARRLAKSVGMGRDRLRALIFRVQAAGVVPGDRARTEAEWEELVGRLFPERLSARTGEARERLEPYHGEIVSGLETNTVTTVWQRLHDERGLEVSVSTFRRYVRERIRAVRPEDVKVPKDLMPPGRMSEVDYGRLGRWVDPLTGRGHPVKGFVMTLGASRRLFVRPVLVCDQEAWAQCHVAAFEFFGGAPHQVRLDNLKAGVVRPDLYDPEMNHAYQELAAHYQVLLDPCRARRPTDKPQVERAMPYARDSFFKGRRFQSLAEMQAAAERWCVQVADQRPHRRLPGTVGEVFFKVEQSYLLPLPPEPFEVAHWAKATVHPDCQVQALRTRYSVPWHLIGRRLDVRVGERLVQVYDQGVVVKTHLRRRGERRYLDPEDFPQQKVAFLLRTPAWCRRQAGELGEAVLQLVDELLMEPMPLTRLRQAQAVIRLAETHGAERLDAACRRFLEADASYRTVKGLVENPFVVDESAPELSSAGAMLHGAAALLEGVR
jgi:transposase